jgi:AcrR family transcriptional regulator
MSSLKVAEVSEAKRKGRPRSDAAHAAILEAALSLVAKEGFRSLSLNDIAASAKVARATIYRRWPNKAALVMDAFMNEVGPAIAFPKAATVSESIRLQLHLVARSFSGVHGKLIKVLLGEAQFDPDLAEAFLVRWVEPRREMDRIILSSGVESGEFHRDLDIGVVIDEIYGAIYYRLMLGTGSLTPHYMDILFENVMGGLREESAEKYPRRRKRRSSQRSDRTKANTHHSKAHAQK